MTDQLIQNSKSTAGRWTVAAMFGFALTMIALLFLYWHFYTAPFRSLQYAINTRFPNSAPRVVGGQHKSHKEGLPNILRLVVYIPQEDFDPENNPEKSEARSLELAEMAFEHQDEDAYDEMEIILLEIGPAETRKHWKASKTIEEWKQLL